MSVYVSPLILNVTPTLPHINPSATYIFVLDVVVEHRDVLA